MLRVLGTYYVPNNPHPNQVNKQFESSLFYHRIVDMTTRFIFFIVFFSWDCESCMAGSSVLQIYRACVGRVLVNFDHWPFYKIFVSERGDFYVFLEIRIPPDMACMGGGHVVTWMKKNNGLTAEFSNDQFSCYCMHDLSKSSDVDATDVNPLPQCDWRGSRATNTLLPCDTEHGQILQVEPQ